MSGRIVFSDKLYLWSFSYDVRFTCEALGYVSGAEAVTVNIVESELDPSSVL